MSTITRVDEAVTALIAIAKAALPTVDVLDGPVVGELMDEALVVGFADSPDVPGYECELVEQEGWGRPHYIELITVRMMLTLASGDAPVADLRARAAEHLAALDTAYRDASAQTQSAWDKLRSGSQVKWVPYTDETTSVLNVFFSATGSALL